MAGAACPASTWPPRACLQRIDAGFPDDLELLRPASHICAINEAVSGRWNRYVYWWVPSAVQACLLPPWQFKVQGCAQICVYKTRQRPAAPSPSASRCC